MSKMSIMSNLHAVCEAIKADNKKISKPCVLEYQLNFKVELPELLKYLNEYYRSVKSVNFKIPDMSNIKSNIGALTKLGVALLRMPKYMEIYQTTLINSVLSYTIEKKGTKDRKQEREREREREKEKEKEREEKENPISNNVFAVLDDNDDNKENIQYVKVANSTVNKLIAPNAPKKLYGSVLKSPIIHTPIKLNLDDSNFPNFPALVKAKNKVNNIRDSTTPIKLNFAEALSKAPLDDEIATINKQKKLDAELEKISEINQDKLNMFDDFLNFSDISDEDNVNKEKNKGKKTTSWADSDSDDDY